MSTESVYERLYKRAEYALRSHSRELAYEVYGAAKMAYDLNAIGKEDFYTLNDMLVTNGLNKPSAGLK